MIEKIVNIPTVASESSVAAAAPTAIINITRGANSKTIPEIRPKSHLREQVLLFSSESP